MVPESSEPSVVPSGSTDQVASQSPLLPLAVVACAVSRFPPLTLQQTWDEIANIVPVLDEDYVAWFAPLAKPAKMAYLTACSQWLYQFLRHRLTEARRERLEEVLAEQWAWVGAFPRPLPPYTGHDFPNDDEDLDALGVVMEVVEAWGHCVGSTIANQTDTVEVVAAYATQICELVLPPDCGFTGWRTAIRARLADQFKDTGPESWNLKIPRDCLDLAAPLDQ